MDIATAVAKVKAKMDGGAGTKMYQQCALSEEQQLQVAAVLKPFVEGIVGVDKKTQRHNIAELQTKRKDYVTMMGVMCAAREVNFRVDGYCIEPVIAKLMDEISEKIVDVEVEKVI